MGNRHKETASGLRFVNPPGLYNPAPNGYSHLALVISFAPYAARGRAYSGSS